MINLPSTNLEGLKVFTGSEIPVEH